MKYYADIKITNYDDILAFANSLQSITVFSKLSSEEKLKILYSYPFKFEIINKDF